MRLLVVLAVLAPLAVSAQSPFPVALGGHFELSDQTGATRTETDPDGRLQLVFFGYANCQQICSAALPLMADVTDAAAADGIAVRPILITVDPERDTPEFLASTLGELHPDFLGLTGSEEALEAAYDAFQIEKKLLFEDPFEGPIFAHGSHIFLLAADGTTLSLIPPVLPTDQIVTIVEKYARSG
jgi:protein SCO1